MKYTVAQLGEMMEATLLQAVEMEAVVRQVVFDSRRVDFPKTSIFFAFKSIRNDGHQYIADLYHLGVRHFVLAREMDLTAFPKANFLLVSDPLHALQAFAIQHRATFDLAVIGITGSNGKTIIKEWLFQLLHDDYDLVRSPRSFNSQIGVPLSVLQIAVSHELAIFEAGISKVGEMARLAPIVDCSIGIFTNIGQAHDEGFEHINQKIQEKLILFKHCKTLIFCKDHLAISKAVHQLEGPRLISWSKHQEADLRILEDTKRSSGIRQIRASYQGRIVLTDIPFSDPASVENAIHCWLTLLVLEIPLNVIQKRMAKLDAIPMRLDLKSGINGSTIINDSYNSDLTSLSFALHFLEQQSGQLSRTVILSDIFQSGQSSTALYKEVAQLLKDKSISRIIGIGKAIQVLEQMYPKARHEYYPSTTAFLKQLATNNFQKEIILLKGARHFEFEKIAHRLAHKSHNTRLEIDLDALRHNLNTFKQIIQPKTKVMVMIKAAAYGSGSDEVGRLLQSQQVDYLAVAYADEGVALRNAGIKLPIMVLNPEKATFDIMLRHQLEPEIYSLPLLKQLIDYLSPDQNINIHLKLDTGMHRLGFEAKDIGQLNQQLRQYPNLNVCSIFSHLAASDEALHDGFTTAQFQLFQDLYEQISQTLPYRPIRHLLNSSGIIRFPQYQMDMVRLGIGIYGIDVNGLLKDQLLPVLSLKARISQIKTVAQGETIGYSRRGKALSKLRIATISIGYADGLLRKAGNGQYAVLIQGKAAKIIGNVCMDMTMIDISHIPEASEGDEVVVFGKEHPVKQLAACYDSLIYEVFTGISERVKRVYFQE